MASLQYAPTLSVCVSLFLSFFLSTCRFLYNVFSQINSLTPHSNPVVSFCPFSHHCTAGAPLLPLPLHRLQLRLHPLILPRQPLHLLLQPLLLLLRVNTRPGVLLSAARGGRWRRRSGQFLGLAGPETRQIGSGPAWTGCPVNPKTRSGKKDLRKQSKRTYLTAKRNRGSVCDLSKTTSSSAVPGEVTSFTSPLRGNPLAWLPSTKARCERKPSRQGLPK